ncbi:hypothetical protein HII36_27075 [Nonomuraea sp. NN258]|uniref:diaminopimelate decarboxylase family protein n=1 Tax=Nonomuraea antri TaxID=2730852 RepID=UPI001568FF0F|nr:hypothetical protein [Nonomuraea antri]NRQ35465.1 hypothetical protein [Nonomuraea antri]
MSVETPVRLPLPALAEAARTYGTPLYVTDVAELNQRAALVEDAFPDPWIRQYSLKANDDPAIVRRLAERGWGGNVVSSGEWRLAREAGLPNSAITLEGIGKTDEVLREVVAAAAAGEPLRWVALESADEAVALAAMCAQARLDHPVEVLLRLNPQVEPETLAGLAVGKAASKFGMTADEIRELAGSPFARTPGLVVRGVHVHVGSQLNGVTAWAQGAAAAVELAAELNALLGTVDTVDFGGGFPAGDGDLPAPADFRAAVEETLAHPLLPARLAIEPGRALVAASGWLIASVLHVRRRGGRQQAVIDAGMTELVRPALYGARHPIHALDPVAGEPEPTGVEGPICESADSFGLHDLPPLRRGDLVAIENAGAYAASLSSRYNGRPKPALVFIEPDGTFTG